MKRLAAILAALALSTALAQPAPPPTTQPEPTPEPMACVPGTRQSGEYDLRRWVDTGTRYGSWIILPCDAPTPPTPTPPECTGCVPCVLLAPVWR
jgi:hypothetical protein